MPRLQLSAAAQVACEALVARYPEPRGALLPALLLAQEEFGACSDEVISLVAQALDLPRSEVLAAASFHPLVRSQPPARHQIRACAGLSCRLAGSVQVLQILEERLGIAAGESTADGQVALERCECLGACATAPVLLADGELQASLTRRLLEQHLERLGL
ncbi:MAG: NAD(P)H-dependent oxidoreductase subunit E [Gemmatimonadota bacterium]